MGGRKYHKEDMNPKEFKEWRKDVLRTRLEVYTATLSKDIERLEQTVNELLELGL